MTNNRRPPLYTRPVDDALAHTSDEDLVLMHRIHAGEVLHLDQHQTRRLVRDRRFLTPELTLTQRGVDALALCEFVGEAA